MAEDTQQQEQQEEVPQHDFVPWKEFLESYPVGTVQHVSGFYTRDIAGTRSAFERLAPILRLYCEKCRGMRNFGGHWQHGPNCRDDRIHNDFLVYTCKDCDEGRKTFCVATQAVDSYGNGCATKIGEIPELHVGVPESLRPLLGDSFSLLVKGLRCEKRSLGIGAFTYYRRVVEGQKSSFIREILKVAEKLGAPKHVEEKLRQAACERQFTRAVDLVKDAIPESLLVDSHNPVKLLHQALSIGVHSETDENCLRLAHNIRMVLADLSERINLALREQTDLRAAVADLLDFNAEAKKKAKRSHPTHAPEESKARGA